MELIGFHPDIPQAVHNGKKFDPDCIKLDALPFASSLEILKSFFFLFDPR
jgi:hypothetical protein